MRMSIWGVPKRGLGTTDGSTRPAQPSFELLEPRLLLSADPAGLAGQISPDFLDDQGAAQAAIVIDQEPVASGEWLVASDEGDLIVERGSQITEEQALASDLNALSWTQIQTAASLPATQLTNEQTPTERAWPSGDGIEIPSQLQPFSPSGRAAGTKDSEQEAHSRNGQVYHREQK